MSSIRSKEFEDHVVFDDDQGAFSPDEAEFTVVQTEPIFTLARLWKALLWLGLGIGAFLFGFYHTWLMYNVHEAQTSFSRISPVHTGVIFAISSLRISLTNFIANTMGIVGIALAYMIFAGKRSKRDARNDDLPMKPGKPIFTTNCLTVVLVGLLVGFVYFGYALDKLREIRNVAVEREISFRTECGFYYSYYKQLVQAPTLMEGIVSLTNDMTSEFPSPVNALARFNIHPEVVLAFLYRNFGDKSEDPIFFYSRCVWLLQGIQASALFVLAAIVCRSLVGGFLSTIMFCHIRPFATRAFFTVSLRENFSMPFFWLRLLFVTLLFRSNLKGRQRTFCLAALCFSTFCFSSSWQLSPFLIFSQGLPLYGGAMLNALHMPTVENIMCCDALVVFIVGLLHFAYPLFLSSPAIFCALIVFLSNRFYPPPPGPHRRFWSTLFRCVFVAGSALFVSGLMKRCLGVADDNHVFKLFLAKLNLAYHHDFDVNMYLASSVFRAQTPSFFLDMTFGAFGLYAVYATCHIIFLLGALQVFEETTTNRQLTEYEAKKKDLDEQQQAELVKQNPPSLLAILLLKRPELTANALYCVPMAALGIFIQRLQLLWTPHMCVFYAWVLSTPAVYTLLPLPTVLRRWFPRVMRYLLPIFLILVICSGYIPSIKRELSYEYRQTFSDPDAVALMDFIANKTRPSGIFAGSMQLMSAVRLSTGRAITNHPHYENGDLREKTLILYEAIYGRSSIADSYKVFRNMYGVDYIVIEPSICFAPDEGHPFAAFRMVDLIDQHKGLQPEMGPFSGDPRLTPPVDPENPKRRKMFCELLQPDKDESLTHVVEAGLTSGAARHPKFQRVYKNPTFWVYEVLQ